MLTNHVRTAARTLMRIQPCQFSTAIAKKGPKKHRHCEQSVTIGEAEEATVALYIKHKRAEEETFFFSGNGSIIRIPTCEHFISFISVLFGQQHYSWFSDQ